MNFKKPVSRMETGLLLIALVTAPLMGFTSPQPAAPMKGASTQKLPPPGGYKIDPAHSFAFFGARHHVVGLVRGRFDKVTGTVISAKDPAACALDVTIDVASINTQIKQRDEDLLGPAYFDVKSFPTMTYKGQGLRRISGNEWIMDGTLTMHGVSRPVPLAFTYKGAFADTPPNEPMRVAFHGTAAVKRADFNMGARDNLDELGMLTTPDVAIEIDVEADAAGSAKKD